MNKFAVEKLRLLSDSGIYETLELERIHQAAAEIGDFHYIIHLQLSLSSPYFQSGKTKEDFEMMVLTPKRLILHSDPQKATNGSQSIAINEFPVMNERAIEQFWIRKVEARREQRRKLFAQWQQEAKPEEEDAQMRSQGQPKQAHEQQPPEPTLFPKPTTPIVIQPVSPSADGSTGSSSTKKKKKLLTWQTLQQMSTKQLRQLLSEEDVTTELRTAVIKIIDQRWDELQQLEQTKQAQAQTSIRPTPDIGSGNSNLVEPARKSTREASKTPHHEDEL